MNTVIDFKKRSLELALKKYESTGIISDIIQQDLPSVAKIGTSSLKRSIDRSLEIQELEKNVRDTDLFIMEYEIFLSNMRTYSSSFMFPTILYKYRRGINPVSSIYHSTQEAIFKFDRSNTHHIWLLSLFDDEVWRENLISSVNKDLNSAEQLLFSSKENPSHRIKDDVKDLTKLIEDFYAYLSLFTTVNSWKKDNIKDL